ncbi:hypothetical protein MRX96_020022 [Rhipicephalus microplus]
MVKRVRLNDYVRRLLVSKQSYASRKLRRPFPAESRARTWRITCKQEPKVKVSKAKRKAPPTKDESDSEMFGVESLQNKMLEELLRISKENQLSIIQLALRMRALESKVGAIEDKVVAF